MLQTVQTGDVLLVKGNGLISKFIRVLTGESYSHVAMLCVNDLGHVCVREFVEGTGYKFTPSVLMWMQKREGQEIFYGEAPIELDRYKTSVASSNFPFSESYGYASLFKVLAGQIFNVKFTTRQKVCSTYIQHCWETGGFKDFDATADPGDIANYCECVAPLEV
jgi:hypothetical protein